MARVVTLHPLDLSSSGWILTTVPGHPAWQARCAGTAGKVVVTGYAHTMLSYRGSLAARLDAASYVFPTVGANESNWRSTAASSDHFACEKADFAMGAGTQATLTLTRMSFRSMGSHTSAERGRIDVTGTGVSYLMDTMVFTQGRMEIYFSNLSRLAPGELARDEAASMRIDIGIAELLRSRMSHALRG
jgi:hypothetical protein